MLSSQSLFIDQFIRRLTKLVSWCSLFMVLLTMLVVVLRYGFNIGVVWLQEVVMYLHACLFMIGCAYTLQSDQHVRVDVFYSRLPKRKQICVNLFGHLFLLIPVCSFIAWSSGAYVINAWKILEGSGESGGLNAVFLLKTLIWLFSLLMIVQALSLIAKCVSELRGQG